MFLVDTSVWINYFRENENPATLYLANLLDENLPFGITSIIYQEILQGAATEKDLNTLTDYFSTQHFFNPKDDLASYQKAAKLYFNCRKKGITIRSSIDCLIAQIAIEHKLILLHNDRDYVQISRVAPALKLAP